MWVWCDGGMVWLDQATVGSLASSQVCAVAWGFVVVVGVGFAVVVEEAVVGLWWFFVLGF